MYDELNVNMLISLMYKIDSRIIVVRIDVLKSSCNAKKSIHLMSDFPCLNNLDVVIISIKNTIGPNS